jgi:hypothetical protein
MTTTEPPVRLACPVWCRAHSAEDADRLGGGVTAQHESAVLTWSEDAHNIAGIRRIDQYADGTLEGIFIADQTDALWDLSGDQARRLADVLVKLADELEATSTAERASEGGRSLEECGGR